jgi:hypothetical protein
MSRGYSAKEQSFTINKDYQEALETLPLSKWKDAGAYYNSELEFAKDAKGSFEERLTNAKSALSNPNFDWEDKRLVSNIVPYPAEESQLGGDGESWLESRLEEDKTSDPAWDDAETKDREYEDAEGEPASLRGNSEVDRLRGEWAKGVIKELVKNEDKLRKDYDNAMSAKTIIDRFKKINKI